MKAIFTLTLVALFSAAAYGQNFPPIVQGSSYDSQPSAYSEMEYADGGYVDQGYVDEGYSGDGYSEEVYEDVSLGDGYLGDEVTYDSGVTRQNRFGNLRGKRSGKRSQRHSRLASNGIYLSADLGLDISEQSVEHIGNTEMMFGGTPVYDLEDSIVARLGIGKRWSSKWRSEFEASHRSFDVDATEKGSGVRTLDKFSADGSRETTAFMISLFRDFNTSTVIKPYLRAGAGISLNRVGADHSVNILSSDVLMGATPPLLSSGNYPERDTTEFAWGAGGGFAVPMSERLTIDIEYQYVDLGPTSTLFDDSGDALDFGRGLAHEFTVGFRFEF